MEMLSWAHQDQRAQLFATLAEIYPEAFVHSKSGWQINEEALKALLDGSCDSEGFDFTWPGNLSAALQSMESVDKTFKAELTRSRDWQGTRNLYLEGDNLEVLKLLQSSYRSSIKMIYIDPPYNTGNDFIYNDKRHLTQEEYDERLGTVDANSKLRLFKNTNTSGRFHAYWCSMIYARLLVARDLLRPDGVIFISIDTNEVHNLRKIADKVFGGDNFISDLIWERAFSPKNDSKTISKNHDFVLMYAKDSSKFQIGEIPIMDSPTSKIEPDDGDPHGLWSKKELMLDRVLIGNQYDITSPSGKVYSAKDDKSWLVPEEVMSRLIDEGYISFGKGQGKPVLKAYVHGKEASMAPTSMLIRQLSGDSQEGSQELKALMNDGSFDGPKPVRLIRLLMGIANVQDQDIVLDFFSGSATTAHAVMQANARDGGERRFILVQIPEQCEVDSVGFKAGYRNICEIGQERIRRAGDLCLKNALAPIDVGFRVFSLVDVPRNAKGQQTFLSEEIEGSRAALSDIDLLFAVTRALGLPLDLPYRVTFISENYVYHYGAHFVACFGDGLGATFAKELLAEGDLPPMVVVKHSGFAHGKALQNFAELMSSIKLYVI